MALGENAAIELVRAWKARDVPVLCYGDGARGWPLAEQCAPLACGACDVLDSARASFPEELSGKLSALLEVRFRARDEEQTVRATLRHCGMIGESPAMRTLFRAAVRVSELSDVPVLVTGETGTGKELLARALHQLDPKRRAGPCVVLNCSAITAALAESQLFGHRRGAFTGADRDHLGLFRAADKGVLFLDEVGELDAPLQAKLLRVLQEGRVLGVGECRETPIDVRVIAATNCDLPQMVAERRFRADLYHRLNVVSLTLPPLRERTGDIPILVEYFLEKHRALAGGTAPRAQPEFLDALSRLELRGNFRELENLLCQALANRPPGSSLGLPDLTPAILRQLATPGDPVEESTPSPAHALGDWRLLPFLGHCEKQHLENALRHTRGNQARAAQLLGITPRSIYNKLRKYRLASGEVFSGKVR